MPQRQIQRHHSVYFLSLYWKHKSTVSFHSNSWHMSIIKQKKLATILWKTWHYTYYVWGTNKIKHTTCSWQYQLDLCKRLFSVIYKHSLGPTCHPGNKSNIIYKIRIRGHFNIKKLDPKSDLNLWDVNYLVICLRMIL